MPRGVVKERVDVAAGSTGLGSCSTVACPIGWPGSSIAREGPVGSVLMVLMVGPMPRVTIGREWVQMGWPLEGNSPVAARAAHGSRLTRGALETVIGCRLLVAVVAFWVVAREWPRTRMFAIL